MQEQHRFVVGPDLGLAVAEDAGPLPLQMVPGGQDVVLILLGVALFGAGIGNATSLPPLIAQREFAAAEITRVVSLIVAMGQAGYAFAPAAFGLLRALAPAGPRLGPGDEPLVFIAAAAIQVLAILCFLAGRQKF